MVDRPNAEPIDDYKTRSGGGHLRGQYSEGTAKEGLLAVGRRNWLHVAGDGGLPSAAMMLSIAASAKRHLINPWIYVRRLHTTLPLCAAGGEGEARQ